MPVFCSCGGGGADPSASPPPPPPPGSSITVSVSPSTASARPGNTVQFAATVTNTTNTGVTWQAGGTTGGNATVGTISATGLYTAPATPPNPPTLAITAVSQADPSKSGSASVTVLYPQTTVILAPRLSALTTSQTQQFQASGQNTANSSVTWSVDGISGGNATVGTITAAGLYTPAAAGLHNVTATSLIDPTVSATVVAAVTDLAGVFTWRNDKARTGQNLQELALAPTTVNATSFGKLFACPVDGYVYAQPLYVANLAFPGSVSHNVVYVATEHNSVYAFDADSPVCSQLWKVNLLGAEESTVSSYDVGGSTTIVPEIGITGTPVIDPQSKTLYVVAKSKNITTLIPTFIQRLHALDLVTGQERSGSPVVIQASVKGTGDGTDGNGNVLFAPLQENQRAALLLSGVVVYVAFASHGDLDPYHGWLLGYDAATLGNRNVFNTTPNGGRGGIWQSGGGPSADANGNIFAVTGNGTFDASPCQAGYSCIDYGNTFLKLSSSSGLVVADFFTPFNQAALSLTDLDVGATAALLLPDQPGAHPHLLLGGSKAGVLYLLDRDNLGRFNSSGDQIVQSINLGSDGMCGICGTPAYWQGQNAVYVVRSGDFLRAYQLSNGLLPSAPTSVGSTQFGFPGAAPAISSNGSADGIVWTLDNSGFAASQPAVLHAYDAANVANELYNSSQAANARDAAGPAVKFTVPTVANGKVYVGGQGQLTAYGLLP